MCSPSQELLHVQAKFVAFQEFNGFLLGDVTASALVHDHEVTSKVIFSGIFASDFLQYVSQEVEAFFSVELSCCLSVIVVPDLFNFLPIVPVIVSLV